MRIRQLLSRASTLRVQAESVVDLKQAVERLAAGGIDVMLLDLNLPDSAGLEAYLALSGVSPEVPIVVLTNLVNEEQGVEAVRLGAQDYLLKGRLNADGLGRVLCCAIARHRVLSSLRGMSLTDEMTGLLNRRGFHTVAGAHLKLGSRTGARFLLFFIDVDGLKKINDRWGHHEGDQAIIRVAEVLRSTFRQSDVVARIGGDEFVVLGLDGSNDGGIAVRARLRQNLAIANSQSGRGYYLGLSLGGVAFDSREDLPLADLLQEADRALYREKTLRT
jgi:diguanylate cyclase (GGDEF)-like protein